MERSSTAGIALIGSGRMGSFHGETISRRLPGAHLVAVADPAPGAAEKLAADLGADRAYLDAADVWADPEVDGVVIAAPARFHTELIVAAARAGKHVFCEKPMAVTIADADRAIDACRAAGVTLQIGFNRRFAPDWAAARALLDADRASTAHAAARALLDADRAGTAHSAALAGAPEPANRADTPYPAGQISSPQPAGRVGTPQPAGRVSSPQAAGRAGTPEPAGWVGAPQPAVRVGTPRLLRSLTRDPGGFDPARVAPGTIFLETLIHDFDTLRFLNPGATAIDVFAVADALVEPAWRDRGLLDTAVVTVRFDNGAIGTAEACFEASYGYDVRAEVLGSGGMVTMGDGRRTGMTFASAEGRVVETARGDQELFGTAYTAELAAFVESIRTGAEPPVTGEDARAALEIALAAAESVRTGRPIRIDAVAK